MAGLKIIIKDIVFWAKSDNTVICFTASKPVNIYLTTVLRNCCVRPNSSVCKLKAKDIKQLPLSSFCYRPQAYLWIQQNLRPRSRCRQLLVLSKLFLLRFLWKKPVATFIWPHIFLVFTFFHFYEINSMKRRMFFVIIKSLYCVIPKILNLNNFHYLLKKINILKYCLLFCILNYIIFQLTPRL